MPYVRKFKRRNMSWQNAGSYAAPVEGPVDSPKPRSDMSEGVRSLPPLEVSQESHDPATFQDTYPRDCQLVHGPSDNLTVAFPQQEPPIITGQFIPATGHSDIWSIVQGSNTSALEDYHRGEPASFNTQYDALYWYQNSLPSTQTTAPYMNVDRNGDADYDRLPYNFPGHFSSSRN